MDLAALVRGDEPAISVGLAPGCAAAADLVAAASGAGRIEADGLGPWVAAMAPIAGSQALLVAREGEDGFAAAELQVLEGMARVLGLVFDSLRRLSREREAQRRLILSERQTRQILETAHDAFVAIDSRGMVTDWNPQAEVTFGFTLDQALGRPLAEMIIPERFREAHLRGIARFFASGEGSLLGKRLELSALHRDGHELPIELTISALAVGEGWTFNAFLRDISERKRHERYAEAQHRTAVVLAEAERAGEATPRLLEAIGAAMGWDFGATWRPVGRELRCEVTWTAPDSGLELFAEASRRTHLGPGAGLPGRVFRRARPELVQDVTVDPGFSRAPAAAAAGLRGAVALPLSVHGEVVGVVEFLSRPGIGSAPELLEMMETLTTLIGRFFAIVTEREELRKRLERLALTDELTGLANRRAWNEGLERELARAARESTSLCVALIDLDHFKRYNDDYGHPAGDALLRDAGVAWSSCLRTTDVLARLGGDEFAVAFHARELEAALGVVARLRAATPHGVTCTVGLVQWRPGESAHALLSRADSALYRAKRQERGTTLPAGADDAGPVASD